MNVQIRKIEQVIWKSHDDLLYLPSAYQEMNKQNLLTKACLTKDESQVILNNMRILHLTQNVISSRQSLKVMYQSNRSFNMPPPPGNPPGIWLFWKLLFKFPPTRAKMPFKCPTQGSIQVIKCLHPGDISPAQKWQKDDGSCRTKYL